MRLLMGIAIFGWLCLGTGYAPARADGGSLRLTGTEGRYQISVFSAPTPLRAGPIDISVLLQGASSGDLVTQARVIVRMFKAGRPALEYPATFEAATKQTLPRGQVRFAPSVAVGIYKLRLKVRGDGQLSPAN